MTFGAWRIYQPPRDLMISQIIGPFFGKGLICIFGRVIVEKNYIIEQLQRLNVIESFEG